MLRIICIILNMTGVVIMTITAVRYSRLVKSVKDNNRDNTLYSRLVRGVSLATPFFFIAGYFVGIIDMLARDVEPIFYFVIMVFFVGALFVSALVQNLASVTKSLNMKNSELHMALGLIENHNALLKEEIDRRVQEIVRQDKLLRTVNDAASILLASDVNEFEDVLHRCMEMLAGSAGVDRMHLWENYLKDGTVYTTRTYVWQGGTAVRQWGAPTEDVPLNDIPGGWKDRLSRRELINGPVNTLPENVQELLRVRGTLSILVVPVFMHDEFWGFVGFDDCRCERYFSDEEAYILRSGSLLIANAVLRNEVTHSLLHAREEALSSTKAKSEFLANMSHEIRTPINAITGMAAIARATEDIAEMHGCISKIETASRQLLGIINDVLDMSKIEADKLELACEPFVLIAAIHNIKSIIGVKAAEKNQSLIMDIAPDVPEVVVGDDMRLSQVLLNLLSNAVKFTPEGGTIRLSVRLMNTRGGRHEIEASVLDNGIGMSDGQIEKLFSKFEQGDRGIARRFGGTGLGLVISKNIVELMGGSIAVESAQGQGSRFTARFMLEEGSRDMLPAHDGEIARSFDFNGRTALLAEDVEINREIVMALFKGTGLKVECAENGQIALDMFRAAPEKYDLIFMDVQMPVMDGYSATKELRALNFPSAGKVPIIAMTANAFSEDVENCMDAGMNDHVAKPIDVDMLFAKTAKYLTAKN